MERHLYFICPTDHLEPVINNTYRQENYYLTSLGNSMPFNIERVLQLGDFLRKKGINKITFVLSDENHIVRDILENKDFSGISGLGDFHDQMAGQKKLIEQVWHSNHGQFMNLFYHLNNKINQLRQGLTFLSIEPPDIHGKIYNRNKGVFRDIYADFTYPDKIRVN